MDVTQSLSIMQSAMVIVTKLSAPILLLSMFVGLIIAIFQAATQINEQTMTFVPKLIIIGLVLLVTGGWMLEVMMEFTRDIFALMAE